MLFRAGVLTIEYNGQIDQRKASGTVLSDITTLIAAVGSVIAAISGIIIIFITRRQLALAQKAALDVFRPVIYPTVLEHEPSPLTITFRNVGLGLASNIRGTIFAWRTTSPHEESLYRLSFRIDMPIPKDEERKTTVVENETNLDGMAHVGDTNHSYSLTPKRGAIDVVWRVTITYHDIFGRKHGGVFDYLMRNPVGNSDWRTVAFLTELSADIDDMEGGAART